MKVLRYFLFFASAAQFFLAFAFFQRWPLASTLWPFEGSTPLTFIFVSSFFAAAAAAILWVAATQHYGALAGIGLDYLTILTSLAVITLRLGASGGGTRMTAYGIVCAFGALVSVGVFLWSVRVPIDRTIPMPGVVRGSFAFFIVALLFASIRLMLKMPNTIPWAITPDLSLVMGWMFASSVTYFAYGLLRPSWNNAAGQLAAFLAYDLVLIAPFLARLPTTGADQRLSMIVYIAVLIVSGLLAIYYLFLHKPTRVWAASRRG